MSIFSDESVLLIKNWEAVRDILNAKQRLDKELIKFLYSLEVDLKNTNWWQDKWVFNKQAGSAVYISKRDWKFGNEYVVWIGVEGFVPESLFGYESNATLYVWVSGKRYSLSSKLAEEIAVEEHDVIGEIDRKASNTFVIKHAVTQCLPEEIDSFEEMTRSQIINFITHYARVLERYDELIKESLAEE